MSKFRILLFATLATATLNAKAQSMSAYLDFSQLYAKTNAGQYFVGLTLNNSESAILEISQRLAASPNSDQPGSEPDVCLTEVRLNAGTLSFIMADANSNSKINLTQGLILYTNHYDETEKCSSVESILAAPVDFMPYFNLGTFKLSYSTAKSNEEIFTAISVFPYGYSVTLNISKTASGNFIADNLKSQLAAQIKRNNKQGLSYYTYAQDTSKDYASTLSLGQGFVELK